MDNVVHIKKYKTVQTDYWIEYLVKVSVNFNLVC